MATETDQETNDHLIISRIDERQQIMKELGGILGDGTYDVNVMFNVSISKIPLLL